VSALAFQLPPALEAQEPAESRGLARDAVRLMVASRSDGSIVHASFSELPRFVAPGDLLVLNVSATLPAAVPAHRTDGSAVRVHFATRARQLPDPWFVVELRSPDGSRPAHGARRGERLRLVGGAAVELVAPYASGHRLLLARVEIEGSLVEYLRRHGEPIRYGYVPEPWPLEAYQNAYATTPGSAEMPSAGRPFTPELITRMVAGGILFAPVTLHAGVSSPERHEPQFPEFFEVPESTARLVNAVRWWQGRVVAVGTTAVRALETVADGDGSVRAGSGWTSLVIGPERGVRAVDGLVTGWHEPEASHLQMLEAIAGEQLLAASYDAALAQRYLWHEFGDSHLILG
jgi:S-adenosylmethionine:tRNA ribosyltransferase-isomerase